MMDTIYEMIGWVKYLGTIGDTFERYNTNSIGKKVLLFPILFICVILLILITPFMMVGCLLRLVFVFIDWVNEALDDTTVFIYALDCKAFLNFFIMIFALYGIMYLLYLAHRGLNYVLGKTITEKYEEDLEMRFRGSTLKTKDEELRDEINQTSPNNIYVIDSEDYK